METNNIRAGAGGVGVTTLPDNPPCLLHPPTQYLHLMRQKLKLISLISRPFGDRDLQKYMHIFTPFYGGVYVHLPTAVHRFTQINTKFTQKFENLEDD